MSSERSFDSESMARRFRGLASMGCAQDRRPTVQTVAVHPRRRLATAVAALACSSLGRRPAPTTGARWPRSALGRPPPRGPPPAVGDRPQHVHAVEPGGRPPAACYRTGSRATATGLSPSLSWVAAPSAEQLALVVRDRNADGFVHWIVTGISPTVTSFGEGGHPGGGLAAGEQHRRLGWFPPVPARRLGPPHLRLRAPRPGGTAHVDPAAPAADVAAQIEKASIGQRHHVGGRRPEHGPTARRLRSQDRTRGAAGRAPTDAA